MATTITAPVTTKRRETSFSNAMKFLGFIVASWAILISAVLIGSFAIAGLFGTDQNVFTVVGGIVALSATIFLFLRATGPRK